MTVENDAVLTNLVLPSTATATTLNGTMTLVNTSQSVVYLTGTATGYSVVLPDATTLPQGHVYTIYNTSSQTVLVKTFGGATLFTLSQTSIANLYLLANGTTAGTWSAWQAISDPSVASGILNYKAVSSASFAPGTADILITSMTVTPQAGTYAIWFSASAQIVTNNVSTTVSIYNGASQVTDSIRTVTNSVSTFNTILTTQSTVQFNGTNACEVHTNRSGGTATITGRSLILIRLGS